MRFPFIRSRRSCLAVLVLLALVAGLVVYAAWPGRSTFTVSPETTYVTGPLDKHGYVDYVAALNERLSQGIKPENNANAMIWQALGPHPEGGTMPPEYFQWLGIESPPEEGEYFVPWSKYLKMHPQLAERIQMHAVSDSMDWASHWPWTAEAEPDLADYLSKNERPLAVVIEATRRPQYYNPLVPKSTEDWSPGLQGVLNPNVQKCRELAVALTCRAMLRVAQGKTDEAWQDLLACHPLPPPPAPPAAQCLIPS